MYGEVIKDFRDRNKLKQKQVSNILGISNTLYCDYENENQIMPIKYLNELANYFNCSLDYIFGFKTSISYNNSEKLIDKNLSGLRIKEFRKENKLTQAKLSESLNCSLGTIAGYEIGRYIIATPFLYTICKKYSISADYLLGKTDSPKYLK